MYAMVHREGFGLEACVSIHIDDVVGCCTEGALMNGMRMEMYSLRRCLPNGNLPRTAIRASMKPHVSVHRESLTSEFGEVLVGLDIFEEG